MQEAAIQTDPDSICVADQAKLIAAYERACPEDILTTDDPRRPVIAAEMLDIGLASSIDDGLDIIKCWDPNNLDALRTIVVKVRRSFAKMKLIGNYGSKGKLQKCVY